MAYVDIGHPSAQAAFFAARAGLDFANLDASGTDTWRVKTSRRHDRFESRSNRTRP